MGKPGKRGPAFLPGTAAAALFLIFSWAAPARAFEITVNVPEAPRALHEQLSNTSLVIAAQRQGTSIAHDIVAAARADYRRLLAVLYEHGYFGPVISLRIDGREAALLPPFETLRAVTEVTLHIDTGPRFHFGLARIAPVAAGTEITPDFDTGQVAGTGVISQAASQALLGWRNRGHAKARLSGQSILADHNSARLAVDIDLDPGPKLRFGALRLTGQTRLSEARVHQIASLPEGQVFDPQTLEKIAKRLRRTGVFRSVTLAEADTPGPGDRLDIDLHLQDDKPRRLSFGAELESRDGLSLSAAWLHRNLLGGGERLSLEGSLSGIGGQNGTTELAFQAAFSRPATFHPDTDLGLGAEVQNIDSSLYDIDRLALSAGLTRTLSAQLILSGGLRLEASNAQDDYGARQFRTVGLPLRAVWDLRDDLLDPTEGLFIKTEVMPYASSKDGAPGLRLSGDARTYRALGSERVVAAGRLQIGTILGPGIAETPPDYLFLTGGGGTVRGQPYQSGFVTSGGKRSGGLSFVAVSGELRMQASDAFSVVAFYDAGFVGSSSTIASTGTGNWHAGAGLGMRYHTSIGPIRVDVAVPVSGGSGGGTQLYIGIGQAF